MSCDLPIDHLEVFVTKSWERTNSEVIKGHFSHRVGDTVNALLAVDIGRQT